MVSFFGFLGLIFSALLKEINRNRTLIENSISGVIYATPRMSSGIIKTDNAHVLLFDPETLELVASKTINPFLPPITFNIGRYDSKKTLKGNYRLLILTNKNRDLHIPSAGEVIGNLTQPIPLGSEGIKYFLDRPFQNFPSEILASLNNSPQTSIQGIINVSPLLLDQLDSSDRLVIMLFDKDQARPVAIKILKNFKPPQKFSIGQSNAMKGQVLEGKYSLRILTDKNDQPFKSFDGEIIGRSKGLIPLGTSGLIFELDQQYIR